MAGRIIAVVGAESTGKTTLVHALLEPLAARHGRVAIVPEVLREFCDRAGRTPRPDEQAGIAAEQTARIQQAALGHDLVLADTTALMTAVYSDYLFADDSLYAPALDAQASVDLTLLTSLDLPWVADGLQRDGAHVRLPVDDRVRAALRHHRLPHAVVAGQGDDRVHAALSAISHRLEAEQRRLRRATGPRWRWVCQRCDDGDCEQHVGWLTRPSRT